MTKRLTDKTTYLVERDGRKYAVTLSRVTNTPSGNPRFEALITDMEALASGYSTTYTYRFGGHYMGKEDEAAWIVDCHFDTFAK